MINVLSNLDAYLYQLSEKVTQNGGHVWFAKTKEDATRYILQVAQRKNARKVVKSKADGDRRDWCQSCVAGCWHSGD
ncbi:LUD domain-containing protein [Escherichia coli]